MKRCLTLFLIFLGILSLASCGGKGCDLLILNWGDYIAEEVIEAFEEQYDVNVKVATTDSNEQMYSSIRNKTAEYDLVVPSDYMVHQMAEENLLYKIEYSRLSNYEEDMFVAELQALLDSEDCQAYQGYYIPYFWGSLGIMYNKRKEGIEEAVYTYEWDVFFEADKLPKNTRIAMYSSSRDALAAAELYKGYSLNTRSHEEIDECIALLRNTDFYQWGTDDLKIDVSQGKVDIALVYSGDFFDAYYADLEAEDGMDTASNIENYSIYSPTTHNNVFFDAMVIPNTCTNLDLAYKFLDFILDFDNSYTNADFVGYCPTLQSVYDEILSDTEGWGDILEIKSYNPAIILNTENSWAEVYQYLGAETYSYIERKFTSVIFK